MSYRIGSGNSNANLGMIGTVKRIDKTGIIMQTENGMHGIIPIEYLKQQEINIFNFRIGESFTVFPLSKRHKGGRQRIENNEQPVLCLHYKSRSGKVYKSIKLDRIKNHAVAFERLDEKGRRDHLFEYIESLFWNHTSVYVKLCNYCETGNTDMDESTRNMLIANYVLNEDGSIPQQTSKIIYEVKTGNFSEDSDDDMS